MNAPANHPRAARARAAAALCAALFTLAPRVGAATEDVAVIQFEGGSTIEGAIERYEGDKVFVRSKLGQGVARASHPLARIRRITFARPDQERDLLASTEPKDAPAVEAVWLRRKPALAIPGSDAGEFGQRLADLLLRRGDSNAAPRIDSLLRDLRADWDPGRKVLLETFQLRSMLLAGKVEQALDAAEDMVDLSPDNAAALVEAKFVIAEAEAARLRALEQQNPLWREVPHVAAQRDRHLQAALDNYLYPVVFQTELPSLCARGLDRAAALYEADKLGPEAYVASREVAEFFKDPTLVGPARERMRRVESLLPQDFDKSGGVPGESPQKPMQATEKKQ